MKKILLKISDCEVYRQVGVPEYILSDQLDEYNPATIYSDGTFFYGRQPHTAVQGKWAISPDGESVLWWRGTIKRPWFEDMDHNENVTELAEFNDAANAHFARLIINAIAEGALFD